MPPALAACAHVRARSFIDELPCELLERIITYLSHQPKHKYTKSFAEAEDVLTVLNASLPLRSAARSYFTELIARTPPIGKRSLSVSLLIEECFSRTPARVDHAKFYIGSLNVDCPLLLISLLEALGPAVRKLDLTEPNAVLYEKALHSVVETYATEIEELALDQRMLSTQFIALFHNLRHLTACLNGFTLHADASLGQPCFLEVLELKDLDARSELAPLWANLTHLKELTLTFIQNDWHGGDLVECPYRNIAAHCTKLSTLRLGRIHEWLQPYVSELCEGLSECLKNLHLEYNALHAETVATQLAHIRHLCPQVLVDLTCNSPHFVPALHALGACTRAVRTHSMFHYMPKFLREAAERTSSLRCLELILRDPWACNFLKALLTEVGSGLTELQVCIFPNYYRSHTVVDNNSEALNVVASCTGNLRTLKLEQVRPNASLGHLAIANPNLRDVHLEIDNEIRRTLNLRHWRVEEWLATTTTHFLEHCRYIRHIAIEEQGKEFATPVIPRKRITELDDVCATFRHRNVCIRSGDFYYEA